MSGDLLILTGPPGAGKSTIAARLAAEHPTPTVHLRGDDFFRFVKAGAIPPWEAAAREQNRVVMDALAAAARAYVTGDYLVVLDGIVGPWFLPTFEALGVPLHYVVLRPPLVVTLARGKARGVDALTVSGPLTAMHGRFADLGRYERHAIDTGALDVDATLARVREALDGRYRI